MTASHIQERNRQFHEQKAVRDELEDRAKFLMDQLRVHKELADFLAGLELAVKHAGEPKLY